MFKVEYLKDYLYIMNDNEFNKLAKNIYLITDFLCKDYHKYKEWYFTKQLPAITSDERNILFVRNPKDYNEIIAMTCLKKNTEEKKICTLYVSDKYRGLKVGTLIIEESMKWLGTTKPFITIADYKLETFKPIIKKYNWKLDEIVSNIYNNGSKELCFNGTLTKNNNYSIEKQLYKNLE